VQFTKLSSKKFKKDFFFSENFRSEMNKNNFGRALGGSWGLLGALGGSWRLLGTNSFHHTYNLL
jgi:hypothetical protein